MAVLAPLFLGLTLAGPVRAQPDLSRFEARLDSLRTALDIPGLSVAVVKDRRMIFARGFGSSDDEGDRPTTPETTYWIASITKTFVGPLFLELAEKGVLSLDTPLSALPDWDPWCAWLADSGLPFGRDLDCAAPITLRHVLSHTVNGTPGERFLYNPLMYSRLSRLLAHALGSGIPVEGHHNDLARLVEERILTPAGMTNTMASRYQREKAQALIELAQGRAAGEDGTLVNAPDPDWDMAGGAGIISSVLDLARYDIAIDSGTVFSDDVRRAMFTPFATSHGSTLPYGVGWFVEDYSGRRLVWHSGRDVGFSGLFLKVPESGLTLIALANSEGLWWGNPLDGAAVERSPLAALFMEEFIE